MKTIENSKVGVKMEYLIYAEEKYSSCQPSSTKSDGVDQLEAVEKISDSPQMFSYKEVKALFCISDKAIDLEAKNLLSDTKCFLPDSEEDETSLDVSTGIGHAPEETTYPDSEGQDEGDPEGGALMVPNDDDPSASEDSKNDTEDVSGYSCEMTYIELDLSSQSHEDVSDEMELMMKNLKIEPNRISVHFDSSDATPVKVCVDDRSDEKNVTNPKLVEISEKPVSNLPTDYGATNVIHSSGQEYPNSNPELETRPEHFESFLPIPASSLCSLSDRIYSQIAESLLDEETQLKLNVEEAYLFNTDSYRTTSNTPDIPSETESSDQDLDSLVSPGERDPTYKMCPMTYVDLDINEPCIDDLALDMINNLNLKDDKAQLCRGNPSDQNAFQTDSAPFVDSSIVEDFFGSCLENGETHYENEFVSENLDLLRDFDEFMGLASPEIPNAVLHHPPPPLSLPPHPSLPPPSLLPPHPSLPPPSLPSPFCSLLPKCPANLTPVDNPVPTACQSLNSNVIPRVTTQTLSTQSDAIPTVPGILVVLSTTSLMHGLKRSTCIEMSEPAKKPFGFNHLNNSALTEADSRKKAKEAIGSLTNEQLLEFENNESRLHEAVRTMNYEYVVVLLKRLKHADLQEIINSKNDKSQTPLHLAVQANIPAIVHLLIQYGAEVSHLVMTPSMKMEAPLHYIASRGRQFNMVFKILLGAKDLDLNIRNSEGQTALHCAAEAHGTASSNFAQSINSEYIIRKLLAKDADPLIQDHSGKNVLMYAIESKDLNLVSLIVKAVSKDQIQTLLASTTLNGQTCFNLAHNLKEQFTPVQWEKLNNILTRHISRN